MDNEFEFSLHSPMTKEDWAKISDAEHEHTTYVTFQTPQGKHVKYIKYDILNKIRTAILDYYTDCERMRIFSFTANTIKQDIADIFDKYIEEGGE